MSSVIGAGTSSMAIPEGGLNVNVIVAVLVPMPAGVNTTLKVQLDDGSKTNEPTVHGPAAGVTLNSAVSVTVTLATCALRLALLLVTVTKAALVEEPAGIGAKTNG